MPDRKLARARLVAGGLIDATWTSPVEAVRAFGVMQGQDLPGAMASAALRSTGSVADVIEAMNADALVRGYPMRGTVFLSTARDLRWITELCVGRSLADAKRRLERHDGLTPADIRRLEERVRELASGEGISRQGFMDLMTQEGLSPRDGRGYHCIFHLIAEGVLCYGRWNGVDQQLMLADEVLGGGIEERYNGDEVTATAQLAASYFRTHGPATVRDFAWWCKLPLTKIRAALPLLPDDVEPLGDETYASARLPDSLRGLERQVSKPLLLPGFDEYILGYPDRLFAMDQATHDALVPGNNGVFRKAVVVDGVVRAFWTRGGRVGRRSLELTELAGIPKRAQAGVRRRFAEYPFVQA